MPSVLPADFSLLTNQVVRIPLAQACTVAKKLAAGEMQVRYAQVFGKHRKWVEFRADYSGLYTLVFGLNEEGDVVTNLWVVLTPSGKVFSVDHEGAGNPANILTRDIFAAVDKLLPQSTERKIVVSCYYRVEQELPAGGRSGIGPHMDHGSAGPKGFSFPQELAGFRVEFTSEEEAMAAAGKLIAYLSDQRAKTEKQRTKEAKKPGKK